MRAGVYIHIPYCRGRCGYCDFFSVVGCPDGGLVRRLEEELVLRADRCPWEVDSVYFGGGTPSLLPVRAVGRLLEAVGRCLRLRADAEVTVEANPEDVTAGFLRGLRAAGVNRVSLGVQSFSDAALGMAGRRADAAVCRSAVRRVARVFGNWSVDLMLGLPGRSKEDLFGEVRELVAEGVPHLSLYGLHLSRVAAMRERMRRAGVRLKGYEAEYFGAAELLEAAGFRHYEVSNWARPGRECRHNLHYWRYEAWLGLGPSASSLLGDVRVTNRPDLWGYLGGRGIPAAEEERLDGRTRRREYVMMRLRLAEGVEFGEYRERTGREFGGEHAEVCRRLVAWGYGVLEADRFRLTRRGWWVSNAVIPLFWTA